MQYILKLKEEQWLLNEKYHGKECSLFFEDCNRLRSGEPADFVLGWREFLSCKIDLSLRPLIPRQETEWWVERAMQKIYKKKSIKVLDIFGGSGCIGIALLKQIPEIIVDFADIDENALEQISINCEINKLEQMQYRILKSDVFTIINPEDFAENKASVCPKDEYFFTTYDYIFANPPYVAENTAHERVQKSVAEYEPSIALYSGQDGLDVICRFLESADLYLKQDGVIFMEHDDTQYLFLKNWFEKQGVFAPIFHKDQYGSWRWVEIKKQ